MNSNPICRGGVSKQHLEMELFYLCGADKLNLIQWRQELKEMPLAELLKLRDEILDDYD